MKFVDMIYQRPNLAEAAQKLEELARQATAALCGEALLEYFREANTLMDEMETAFTLASIRHTVDTQDSFYSAEKDYFDEHWPLLTDRLLVFYRTVLACPHRQILDKAYGPLLCRKLELEVQSSDERLISLHQEENALETRYEKLYASARIPFQGEERTIAQLTPFMLGLDRSVRRAAFEAEGLFFEGHREELDEIYDKMVKNRAAQAKLLGYNSFTALGDIRMQRLGYGRKEIVACRREVACEVTPLAARLFARQAARIGLPDFKIYDTKLEYPDGNPSPKGSPEEILAAGQAMYRELSPETAKFIDFMMQGDLFDVLAKPGKAFGGYCTFIPSYQSPFIFSNFNGTAGDVDVLTHEAGHAFAAYLAAGRNLPQALRSPGLESCEIHSMSMEFLTERWHSLFFKEDTGKYALSHTQDALCFLPYGCMVDEFQQCVYDEPHLSPAQRCELWLELEKTYRPWVDFDGLPFYGRGAGWQRQLHIYTSPFYYIDYVLAQVVALQFFLLAQQDFASAWQRYLALVQKAGCESYTGLVEAAGLRTPFTPGLLREMSGQVAAWIEARPLY